MKERWLPVLIACALLAGCGAPPPDPDREDWIPLFDGSSLDAWTPKVRGQAWGEDADNVFRVEDGLLKAVPPADRPFGDAFGHLFHEGTFGFYRLRVEYRFVGEQAPEGPGWAWRNSGVMIHGQPGETMTLNQDFPVSIEVQLLGGNGTDDRPTANLCTPGTHVEMGDVLVTRHCVSSASETHHGDEWVTAEVEVLGADEITHRVDSIDVLRYQHPQMGGGSVDGAAPSVMKEGWLLTEGSISVQSESHPVEFRRIDLLPLRGCTDPDAVNFKRYYRSSDASACEY